MTERFLYNQLLFTEQVNSYLLKIIKNKPILGNYIFLIMIKIRKYYVVLLCIVFLVEKELRQGRISEKICLLSASVFYEKYKPKTD